MRYFFVTITWESLHSVYDNRLQIENLLIEHEAGVLHWLAQEREKTPKENYKLLWFQEIDKKTYEELDESYS